MVLFVYECGYMYLCGVSENGIHQLFFYIIMNYKKPIYETPDMKVFEMHIEGVMCTSELDNYYGLRHFTESDVTDESDDWN